jgi:hypothetical protein
VNLLPKLKMEAVVPAKQLTGSSMLSPPRPRPETPLNQCGLVAWLLR